MLPGGYMVLSIMFCIVTLSVYTSHKVKLTANTLFGLTSKQNK